MMATKKVVKKRGATVKEEPKLNYCTMQLSEKCKNKEGMLPHTDFYSTISPFYSNGRLNICKHCLKEYVYTKGGNINTDRLKQVLRIYDIPFFEKEWKASLKVERETLGAYFSMIYLNHKDKGWIDSDFKSDTVIVDDETGEISVKAEQTVAINTNSIGEIDQELYDRWGDGFTIKELEWLEKDYAEWITNHDCDKLSVQKLVRLICIKELEIRKAREEGRATEKLEKSLLELLNSSNLTPRTMNAINETDSTKMFGVWLKDIENYKPCEYFEDKSIYEDFDGIGDYFNRFVLRPMRNLLTGSRDFDKEFMIEHEYESGDE